MFLKKNDYSKIVLFFASPAAEKPRSKLYI